MPFASCNRVGRFAGIRRLESGMGSHKQADLPLAEALLGMWRIAFPSLACKGADPNRASRGIPHLSPSWEDKLRNGGRGFLGTGGRIQIGMMGDIISE
jgi:hypothetical protein